MLAAQMHNDELIEAKSFFAKSTAWRAEVIVTVGEKP
jgi:hypothetical protein